MSRSNIYLRTQVLHQIEESASAQPKAAPCLDAIKAILVSRPTYGYRRVTAILRKQGSLVNHKRIYRIMRKHGLLLQAAKPRPARTHKGKVITLASNMRWCSDSFGLQCSNGDQVQVAFALDCCDREVISWVASSQGINGKMVTDLLAQSIQNRFGADTMERSPKKLDTCWAERILLRDRVSETACSHAKMMSPDTLRPRSPAGNRAIAPQALRLAGHLPRRLGAKLAGWPEKISCWPKCSVSAKAIRIRLSSALCARREPGFGVFWAAVSVVPASLDVREQAQA